MRFPLSRVQSFIPFLCAVPMLLVGVNTACGQSTLEAPVGTRVAYALDTGAIGNPDGEPALVYSKSISIPSADWLRLHFDVAELAQGSYLLVSSALDGQTHRLDAAGLLNWKNSTAYLNGDAVDIRLYAAPHSVGNRISIKSLEAGFRSPTTRGDGNQCGICVTDVRTPSTENWAGRLMPIGCTGSIITESSIMISAGHCVGTNQVLQFNVPSSSAACATVNPPVVDQFPVTMLSSINGGVGSDWSVYDCGTNTLGQRPFDRYGQLRRIAATPVSTGAATDIFGYGLDLTCATSQTQQYSPGAITSRASTYYSYDNNVRGGNSGSALLSGGMVVGVVTHCSVSCGGNIATRSDAPSFATAINAAIAGSNTVIVTFSATGVSAFVTVTPADTQGNSSAVVPFLRTYSPGTVLTATAPNLVTPLCFHGWRVNDVDQGPSRSLSFVVDAPVAAQAVYSISCCPADRDDGFGHGYSDGTVDINDLLYFIAQFELGAPAADLDDGSGSGTSDQATDISDLLYFLAKFEAGC